MNRMLRITFRNGDIRMISGIPADRTLVECVTIFRRDGWFMGETWCAPCTPDNVAMIEVVEMNVSLNAQAQAGGTPIDDDSVKRLAAFTSSGIFKPPGEA